MKSPMWKIPLECTRAGVEEDSTADNTVMNPGKETTPRTKKKIRAVPMKSMQLWLVQGNIQLRPSNTSSTYLHTYLAIKA